MEIHRGIGGRVGQKRLRRRTEEVWHRNKRAGACRERSHRGATVTALRFLRQKLGSSLLATKNNRKAVEIITSSLERMP